MSWTGNASMPDSPLVSSPASVEQAVREPTKRSEARPSHNVGSSPKAGRLTAASQRPSTPPFAPIPATVHPNTKAAPPATALLSPSRTGRGAGTAAKSGGGVSSGAAVPVRWRRSGAGAPSVTAGLFRPSATAGLGGGGRSAAQGPSPFPSYTSGGDRSSIIDLRFLSTSTGKPRGSTSRNRSPMVTPRTHGSNASTPSMLAPSRSGVEPPSKILDFLYLGSVQDAKDASFLSRNHIACIINVSMEEYWAVDKDIAVYPFKIEDSTNANISVLFPPTSQIIEKVRRMYYEAKKKNLAVTPRILVHCQKGRSRSPTIVLAYLIARNGWSVAEALEYVSRRRRFVEPNLAFMDALRELQESLSTEERTKRYGLQTLLIKNISARTATEAVKRFFEDRVGCVRGVVMHARGHAPAPSTDHTRPTARCEAASGSAGGTPHPTEPGQRPSPEATTAASGSRPGEGEASPASPGVVQPPATEAPPVAEVAASTTTTTTTPKRVEDGEDNDEESPSGAVAAESGGAAVADPANENTLCLVFFACFEDVKRAREYAAAHPAELKALGPVAGKDIKLTVPIKSTTSASATGSFAGRPTAAAASSKAPPKTPQASQTL